MPMQSEMLSIALSNHHLLGTTLLLLILWPSLSVFAQRDTPIGAQVDADVKSARANPSSLLSPSYYRCHRASGQGVEDRKAESTLNRRSLNPSAPAFVPQRTPSSRTDGSSEGSRDTHVQWELNRLARNHKKESDHLLMLHYWHGVLKNSLDSPERRHAWEELREDIKAAEDELMSSKSPGPLSEDWLELRPFAVREQRRRISSHHRSFDWLPPLASGSSSAHLSKPLLDHSHSPHGQHGASDALLPMIHEDQAYNRPSRKQARHCTQLAVLAKLGKKVIKCWDTSVAKWVTGLVALSSVGGNIYQLHGSRSKAAELTALRTHAATLSPPMAEAAARTPKPVQALRGGLVGIPQPSSNRKMKQAQREPQ